MIEISENVSLLPHNTFGINASAKFFAEYDTVEDLAALLHHPTLEGKKSLHIGSGSNLLFTGDFDGVILHSRIGGIEIIAESENEVSISVGSGVLWDEVCRWAVDRQLYGLENLSGIPGECGAAAVQNIGAYGAEIADVIREVHTLETASGTPKIFNRNECRYGYRSSFFKSESGRGKYIVTSVQLALSRMEKYNLEYGDLKQALKGAGELSLQTVRHAVIAVRNAKLPDPEQIGNAGSFFKNPIISRRQLEGLKNVYPFMPFYEIDAKQVKIPAAWLIEQCGWKGRNIGGAGVYEKQCLVLVNRKQALPQEILQLKEAIVRTVQERFEITIEPEVNIIE